MTDKEIIKALECCTADKQVDACRSCPYRGQYHCADALSRAALHLIKCQQLQIAEVERLISDNKRIRRDTALYCDTVREYYESREADAISAGITEFAGRVKKLIPDFISWGLAGMHNKIDTLVKEMTEEPYNG